MLTARSSARVAGTDDSPEEPVEPDGKEEEEAGEEEEEGEMERPWVAVAFWSPVLAASL
jgi:hypothetical protein